MEIFFYYSKVAWILLFSLVFSTVAYSQSDSEIKELRKQLIQEMDQQLRKLRQEMIQNIDKKLDSIRQIKYLGASFHTTPLGLRTLLNLPSNKGILVSDIDPSGPAQKAGLQNMDILLSFGGKNVSSPVDLEKLVSKSTVGVPIEMNILRRGKSLSLPVVLEKRPVDFPKRKSRKYQEILEELWKTYPPAVTEKKPEEKTNPKENNPNVQKPVKEIDNLLQELLEDPSSKAPKTTAQKANLGVVVMDVPNILRQKENLPQKHGLMVSDVVPESPASKAQIKKWDIILFVDNVLVDSEKKLSETVAKFKTGEQVKIIVISRGETKELLVTF